MLFRKEKKNKKKKIKKIKITDNNCQDCYAKGASPSSGLTLASRSFEHQSIGCSLRCSLPSPAQALLDGSVTEPAVTCRPLVASPDISRDSPKSAYQASPGSRYTDGLRQHSVDSTTTLPSSRPLFRSMFLSRYFTVAIYPSWV